MWIYIYIYKTYVNQSPMRRWFKGKKSSCNKPLWTVPLKMARSPRTQSVQKRPFSQIFSHTQYCTTRLDPRILNFAPSVIVFLCSWQNKLNAKISTVRTRKLTWYIISSHSAENSKKILLFNPFLHPTLKDVGILHIRSWSAWLVDLMILGSQVKFFVIGI
jgi:hypothetical protein